MGRLEDSRGFRPLVKVHAEKVLGDCMCMGFMAQRYNHVLVFFEEVCVCVCVFDGSSSVIEAPLPLMGKRAGGREETALFVEVRLRFSSAEI